MVRSLGKTSDASSTQLFGVIDAAVLSLCTIITLIIAVRLVVPEFVFVDNFEANVFEIAKVITKKHLKDYYKLIATFLVWIASCIFVLPGLYVIPYLTTSMGTTSKWLINLYKEGKTV